MELAVDEAGVVAELVGASRDEDEPGTGGAEVGDGLRGVLGVRRSGSTR